MEAPLLVDALRARDPGAPGALYDTHGENLFRYCWFILGNSSAAQVALRDTLVVAEAHISQLRDPEALRPWLFALARAECLRQQPQGLPRDAVVARPDQPDADRRLVAWHAVLSLTPLERESLELTLRHGMDTGQAALVLGLSLSETESLLERAAGHLEQALAGEILARHGVHSCAERVEALRGWAGELTVALRERLAGHAKSCQACGRYLPRNVSPPKVYSLLPVPAPPQAMRLRIMTCFTDPELVGYRMFVAARADAFDEIGFPDPDPGVPSSSPRAASARASSPRPAAPRASSPRAASARASSPRPAAPRASSPRPAAPRASSPRAAAPRASSPRAAAPRASSPRAAAARTTSRRAGGRSRAGLAAAAVVVAVLIATVLAFSRLGDSGTPVQGVSSASGTQAAAPGAPATSAPGSRPSGGAPGTPHSPGLAVLGPASGRSAPTPLFLRGSPVAYQPSPSGPSGPGSGHPVASGQLGIWPAQLDLGTGSTGQITLQAAGGPVTWSAGPSRDIRLSSAGGTIPAGQQVTVTVSVTRAHAVSGRGTISIGPGGGTVTVTWTDPSSSPPPPPPSSVPPPSPSSSPSPTVLPSSPSPTVLPSSPSPPSSVPPPFPSSSPSPTVLPSSPSPRPSRSPSPTFTPAPIGSTPATSPLPNSPPPSGQDKPLETP